MSRIKNENWKVINSNINLETFVFQSEMTTFIGNIISTEEGILQLQGDQRSALAEYLIYENVCEKRDIIIHGY